jgi:hypothetical protein
MELSPCRLTLCPLAAASTQFPPDCFKQPLIEACWSLVLVGLALWLLWSDVDGLVVDGLGVDGLVVDGLFGCCWSGVEPALPVCANAIPEVSISAKTNFLFILLLLEFRARRG